MNKSTLEKIEILVRQLDHHCFFDESIDDLLSKGLSVVLALASGKTPKIKFETIDIASKCREIIDIIHQVNALLLHEDQCSINREFF